MLLFKYLIASALMSLSSSEEGGDRWYSVEKRVAAEVSLEEDNPSIWVLFVKSLGSEKFQVRFPQDPTYRHVESGGMEIVCKKEGRSYLLKVEEQPGTPSVEDLYYESEGEWVREHLVQTDSHKYLLKIASQAEENQSGEEFISSFSIEKNR